MKPKIKNRFKSEILEHLPFTAFGAAISIVVLVAVQALFLKDNAGNKKTLEDFFHTFHSLHLFLSALTSTAVSFRENRRPIRSMLIGFVSTLPFCAVSDYLIPLMGGLVLHIPMHLHICAIQEPLVVYPFLAFGMIAGVLSEKKIGHVSYLSHGAHVLVSSFASMFYLVNFGFENWAEMTGAVFLITFLAVIIPCCLSDIILPFSFAHAEHEHPQT